MRQKNAHPTGGSAVHAAVHMYVINENCATSVDPLFKNDCLQTD